MFEGRMVAVVVPAYNEERLIDRVLDTMPAIVDRIIVVDDASRDGTAERLAQARPRLGDREDLAHFVECVRTRQAPRTDGENGLRVLRVLDACQRSLVSGGHPVWLDGRKRAARA